MNSIRLNETTATDKLPVGSSKFLGVPDVWDGFDYPTATDEDGKYYLEFLCQINCAEAAAHDTESVLPETGMIYFFYDNKRRPTRDDATVLYFDGDPAGLKPFILADNENNNLRSQEYAILFGEENGKDRPSDYYGDHSLLGWASDPDQMGLDYEPEGDEVMLIEIDSYIGADVDFNFGSDCGMLCFFINKKDLDKKDFSNTWLIASVY
jgi:uncharacterized protein YwqG